MKELLIFQEMKLFSLNLKSPYFFRRTIWVFHHLFSDVFIFSMLSFLHASISSCFHFFRCFRVHLFTSLFLHCFSGTSFLCCCIASATDLRKHFLLSSVFYRILLPAFIKSPQGPAVLLWSWKGFPVRLDIQTQAICLFESHRVLQLYDQ